MTANGHVDDDAVAFRSREGAQRRGDGKAEEEEDGEKDEVHDREKLLDLTQEPMGSQKCKKS